MARTLTAAMQTEIAKAVMGQGVVLVELFFDSGTERLCSDNGDHVFQSNTFTGIGELGAISPLGEPASFAASGVSLSLSGVPATRIALALDEQVQGRKVQIWLGALDGDGVLIADPLGPFVYRADTMPIDLGKEAVVVLHCETRAAIWARPNERRYNNVDQQAASPGDTFFKFAEEMAKKTLIWPGTPAAASSDVNIGKRAAPVEATRKINDRDGGGTETGLLVQVNDRDGGGTQFVPNHSNNRVDNGN